MSGIICLCLSEFSQGGARERMMVPIVCIHACNLLIDLDYKTCLTVGLTSLFRMIAMMMTAKQKEMRMGIRSLSCGGVRDL